MHQAPPSWVYVWIRCILPRCKHHRTLEVEKTTCKYLPTLWCHQRRRSEFPSVFSDRKYPITCHIIPMRTTHTKNSQRWIWSSNFTSWLTVKLTVLQHIKWIWWSWAELIAEIGFQSCICYSELMCVWTHIIFNLSLKTNVDWRWNVIRTLESSAHHSLLTITFLFKTITMSIVKRFGLITCSYDLLS